ncbi:MAG TPA: hypothetical protein VN026_04370 [Bacteroidia bacterium]|jgi:hypothetical protein|nr:hypothetical protein [Bacteroidia bacterium]
MDEKDKNKKENKVNDPGVSHGEGKNRIVIFKSFEEQEEYNSKVAAALTPLECLEQMRKLINVGYRLNGIDMDKPPSQHSIKFS